MAVTKVCCTCLSFDVEMFSLTDNDVRECFQKATDIKIELGDELLQNLCEECIMLMQKFIKFKDRCLKANERLRKIVSHSTYISEALLKVESRKLFSETMNFDHIKIISGTNLSPIQVKEEKFTEENASNPDLENTSHNSDFRADLNTNTTKDDAKLQNISPFVESDQYELDIVYDVSSVNSKLLISNKFEDETQMQNDFKIVSKSPEMKKLTEKKSLILKRRKALWKSDYAIQVILTEEQQLEELSKRDILESYLNASFKCSYCVQGFTSEEKFEQHMELHDESRGVWECVICKLRYCNLLRLRMHQKSHRSRYKCLTCGVLMKSQKLAMRHQNRHMGIMHLYQCKVCDEKFQHEQLYRRHIRMAHPTRHVCDLCGGYFTSPVHLERHRKNRKDCTKSKYIYECKKCDSRFLKLNSWYGHMLGHAKEKEQSPPTECQICGHNTTSWTDWSYHFGSKHRNENVSRTKTVVKKPAVTFICDVCGSSLSSKARLSLHIHMQHTDENAVSPYYKFNWKDTCEICNKNILRTNMKRHILTHTGEKPFKCDVCGKCFTQAYTRNAHVQKVHKMIDKPVVKRRKQNSCRQPSNESGKPKEGSNNFQCSQCPRKCKGKYSLAMHERSHTGEKPFSCDVCQRTYVSKYYLEIHRNIHTGEKPYACDECDQKFTNKSYLQMHKNNHTGEKLYSCDICNMSFKLKSNLKRHGIVHTGARDYTCDLCGKTFSQSNALGLHIKTVHLHLPHPPRKPRKKK